MNEIKIFENTEFGSVRTIAIDGEPYFVGKDVAVILGYSNPRDALAKHVDDEDKGVAKCDTLGGIQDLTVINESGLYSLILSSKMPNAKKFKHWVTSEVLPSIRKTGSYRVSQSNTDKSKSLEVKVMNARVRMSNQYLKLASVNTLSEQYEKIFWWLSRRKFLPENRCYLYLSRNRKCIRPLKSVKCLMYRLKRLGGLQMLTN